MRISICGPKCEKVISKVEETLGCEVKRPWEIDGKSTIIDYAAETYKYEHERAVVFAGSAFDFLAKNEGEGYNDVYEQIALGSLMNLDYIAVITMDIDKDLLKVYKDYAQIYPNKFYFYHSDADFELVMR